MEEQPKQQQTWLQENKQLLVIVGVVIISLLIAFTLAVYWFGLNWTGINGGYPQITRHDSIVNGKVIDGTTADSQQAPAKTLWDLLQLLIAPAILSFFGLWFTRIQQLRDQRREELQRTKDQQDTNQRVQSEREAAEKRASTEREIAADNQRDARLQVYLDRMSELLLEKQLRKSAVDSEVRKIARVRTLTVLQSLDINRKGIVLRFLHDAELIQVESRIVELTYADLANANLDKINLKHADLRAVYLTNAQLQGANLPGVNLVGADLTNANLSNANLSGANLRGAYLTGAVLNGTYLDNADLNRAIISLEQLKFASLKGATMPDGLKHP